MAFVDAVFDGATTLDDLYARRVETATELNILLATKDAIPVVIWPFPEVLAALSWSAIVDARMRKRATPENQRGNAPVTIGLGPNFVADGNVDLAIETSWGNRLGDVIESGGTLPLGGEPQPLGGVARQRYVYASYDGLFTTDKRIGDTVNEGAVIATVADTPLRAPIAGIIRGLTRDGVPIKSGTKVIEVDPRGDAKAAFGLGTRPKRIAEGVLRAITMAAVPA